MQADADELRGWFLGRLPDGWFAAAPEITVDREEILVVGSLPAVDLPAGTAPAAVAAARDARIRRFREETRHERIAIAEEAAQRFRRRLSWGVAAAEGRQLFTTLSVPVMTRLRMADRRTLDTLVDAGVARSRSDALAWCVRLVGQHQQDWIDSLRQALTHVEVVRAQGPDPQRGPASPGAS
ncbi:MAG TPA: hypothetical protein VMW49_09665 [Candidatus Dormibacteraeota bacterium]|nr:hypothetical protein [Candidatus Dormibacteraeota bacterium]